MRSSGDSLSRFIHSFKHPFLLGRWFAFVFLCAHTYIRTPIIHNTEPHLFPSFLPYVLSSLPPPFNHSVALPFRDPTNHVRWRAVCGTVPTSQLVSQSANRPTIQSNPIHYCLVCPHAVDVSQNQNGTNQRGGENRHLIGCLLFEEFRNAAHSGVSGLAVAVAGNATGLVGAVNVLVRVVVINVIIHVQIVKVVTGHAAHSRSKGRNHRIGHRFGVFGRMMRVENVIGNV